MLFGQAFSWSPPGLERSSPAPQPGRSPLTAISAITPPSF
jgi:hypothetical protein